MSSKKTPSPWITNPVEQRRHLQSLRPEELRIWLADALDERPYPINPGNEEFHYYFETFFEHSSPGLQERLKGALACLIRGFRCSSGRYQYLYRLIYLAGRLRVTEVYDQLLLWAHNREFVGEFAPETNKGLGKDLHLYTLLALGAQALPNDKFLRLTCERDIEDRRHPAYFGPCYRILYSNYQDSLNYLQKYFATFIGYCLEGVADLYRSFFFIHKQPRAREYAVANLGHLLDTLTDEQVSFLVITMLGKYFERVQPEDVGKYCDLIFHPKSDLKRIDDYDVFVQRLICEINRWRSHQDLFDLGRDDAAA